MYLKAVMAGVEVGGGGDFESSHFYPLFLFMSLLSPNVP